MFPRIISGDIASSDHICLEDKPLIVPLVPTGMKTGVRTVPWGRCNVAARARFKWLCTTKAGKTID